MKAAESYATTHQSPEIVGSTWYNWGDKSLLEKFQMLRKSGAQAIILVANEVEGSLLVKELAALPREERLPVISHWGVSGGDFAAMVGVALKEVDFSVVQTFSFFGTRRDKAHQVLDGASRLFGINDTAQLVSPVGLAHAYDLTHILARAIDKAGTTDRSAVRKALEEVRGYNGLIKDYPQPFTASRHEALGPEEAFMARYEDRALVRIEGK